MATLLNGMLVLFLGHAAGHGILTVPHSKNNGYPGSYALDRSAYYTTASWWLDRAYFGTPKVTPWMRPGHFSWADARDLADVSQTFHPCGCYNPHGVQFCAGVELAHGWGETSMGPVAGPKVTPPQWPLGSQQETAFNLYANHGGGYVYMLCKRTDFLQCQKDLSEPIRSSTREQVDAYLKCIWDCFESNVLEFADSQWLEYQEQRDMNVTMKPSSRSEGTLPAQSSWRWIPIPDTTQITGGGDGTCSWDAVESFSNDQVKQHFTEDFGTDQLCDTGPKVHNPNNWQVKDKVIVPANLPVGEYVLSWRWDCYMADQIWSNCADVEITNSPGTQTTTVVLIATTSENEEPRTQIHWRIAHMLPFETHAASVSRVCGNAELYGVGTVGMRLRCGRFQLTLALRATRASAGRVVRSESDAARARRRAARAERARRQAQAEATRNAKVTSPEADREESEGEDDEPSLALVVVRAARPILRSVQWLANRVLGEKKTNLGDTSQFSYDHLSGQWILRRPSATGAEEESASSTEDQTWSLPETQRPIRRSEESDGGMA
ncbi:unnamed protein product [Cladocopium goreaui]|uniref:Uncharacterized protein n=1 Tax=Cladocopium goreaui TaxID=2562237 RepID=A0A9P1BLU0_9DINO|nr:unnamed protein product [Cladocopium goreaui]